MKKILSMILAAVLLISSLALLTACADEPEAQKLVCGVTIFANMNEKDESGFSNRRALW